jgi:hypothetical protein
MRALVFTITLVFIAMLGVLTALDIVDNGVSALDVISILILVVLGTGVLGAFRNPPPPPRG